MRNGVLRGAPGGEPVGDPQRRFALRADIGVPHRVAIHRGVVERRQVDRRDDIGGKHAAARVLERHRLGLRDRRHALIDQPLDILDREQRAAEGEAVVGELGHQLISSSTASSGLAFATRISATASTSSSDTTCTRAATGPSLAIATMFGSSGARSGLPTDAR